MATWMCSICFKMQVCALCRRYAGVLIVAFHLGVFRCFIEWIFNVLTCTKSFVFVLIYLFIFGGELWVKISINLDLDLAYNLWIQVNLLSISHYLLPSGGEGSWSWSHLTLGKRQGTPLTGHQLITGLTHRAKQLFTLTFTSTGNLGCKLTIMSLDCGNPCRHATCKSHTKRPGSNTKPSCCEATVLTTPSPCNFLSNLGEDS